MEEAGGKATGAMEKATASRPVLADVAVKQVRAGAHRVTLGFNERQAPSAEPERMDGPCSYEEFRDCVRDIAATTRLTLAYVPTLRFFHELVRRRKSAGTMHVVDVGSGGGDVLRKVARWAHKRRIEVRLTGIDLNPHATRAATEISSEARKDYRVEWLTGDVLTHPGTQRPDAVISSLVTHHMEDAEIVVFLRWMEANARQGWFISDLRRSARSYTVFKFLARWMRWHGFVQNDGLVSIRRAFVEEDWQRLLRLAGIPEGAARIERCAVGRLCVTRWQ